MPNKTGLDPTDRPLPPLTDLQAKCLQSIKDFAARTGHPPTLRELANLLELKSTFSVRERLHRLEDKGRITRVPGTSRNIVVIER